jgi:peptidoglycan/LPS O-acetylase OafA/YrhL
LNKGTALRRFWTHGQFALTPGERIGYAAAEPSRAFHPGGRMRTPQPDAGPAGPKMECLEAIRGLASLSVVVGHIILAFWPALYARNGPLWEPLPWWLRTLARFPGKFLWDGEQAVSIFFVLSGFVLSLSFFQRGSASALGSAAIRRYPRLMLPVAGSVLLAFLLLSWGAIASQEAVRHMDEAQGLALDPHAAPGHSNNWLRNYYPFAPDGFAAVREGLWDAFRVGSRYNPVLWTMPIELVGSFLVFGFLALFGGVRNRWLLYAIGGGLLFARGEYHYLDFLLGVALCDLWAHNQRTWRKALPLMPALALIAAGVFLVPWKPVKALAVVAATAASPAVQRQLRARWLALLGRLSFGLYLVHMPIVCSLGCGLYLFLCRGPGWGHVAASLVAALAALAGSLLAALGFYHAIDRPAILLTRALDSRLFRPREDAASTTGASDAAPPFARAA